jgi:hypothetical protein
MVEPEFCSLDPMLDSAYSEGLARPHQCGQRVAHPHKLVFGSSMKQAYYTSTIASFLKEHPETVLGYLAAQHAHDLDSLQRNAWVEQIKLLQKELRRMPIVCC